MHDAIVGRNYMILVGFGMVYVGRFVKPAGLQGAVMEECSMIYATNNGPNWPDLARDAKGTRAGAEFRRWDGPKIFPHVWEASEWKGELPR